MSGYVGTPLFVMPAQAGIQSNRLSMPQPELSVNLWEDGVRWRSRQGACRERLLMWRGLTRLIDIQLGFNLAEKMVGN